MAPMKAVLMAGGNGERFWPLSRPWLPKQFLDLDGQGSLILKTYRRIRQCLAPEDIFVSTRADFAQLVRQHLPDVPAANLILEPVSRDTAASLGLAALALQQADSETIMVALPADHLVADEGRFLETLLAAAAVAQQTTGLVTLGLHPTRPETGYGFIQVGDATGECRGHAVHRVRRFVEKPDLRLAQRYLDSGEFLWNSGIFAWSVAALRREIATYLPALHAVLEELAGEPADCLVPPTSVYEKAPKISVDFGVLEKSSQVYVLPGYFGWDDVGTWAAVDRLRPRDEQGNALRGNVLAYDAHNLVVDSGPGRIVAIVGVSDLVVVDTDDALLVCHKSRAQDVRQVAERAQGLAAGQSVVAPAIPPAPSRQQVWGQESCWASTPHYVCRTLVIRAGQELTRQLSAGQHETLYFQSGQGRLHRGGDWGAIEPGQVFTALPGEYQLAADTDLVVLSVATPLVS